MSGGGDGEFDISNKDEKWVRGGNLNDEIQWKRFFEYVDKVENEHIIIQLNNGSVAMDTKWIKALYLEEDIAMVPTRGKTKVIWNTFVRNTVWIHIAVVAQNYWQKLVWVSFSSVMDASKYIVTLAIIYKKLKFNNTY